MNIICSNGKLRIDQTAKLSTIITDIIEQVPNPQINIIELLHDNNLATPSKKGLIIANAINDALGGEKTIVAGATADKDYDEIGITSFCGNAYDSYVLNFIGESESVQVFLSDAPEISLTF